MTARTGMTTLITRLRQMTEAGTADYAVAGTTYWTDADMQSHLDTYRVRVANLELVRRPEYVSGKSIYVRYEMPRGIEAVEGTAGGTTVFRVSDSTGATVAFSAFTFGDREMAVEFTADQEGSARYFSGFIYNIQAAAGEVWKMKAAHSWTAINFSADFHKFDREAIYAHCLDMAKLFGRSVTNRVGAGRMVRTDLAGAAGHDSEGL